MSNYKSLFALRLLKSTVEIFVNSFFIMYFLTISNQNVLQLGVYYILVYLTVYLSIYFLGNYSKNNRRIYLLRIGIVLNLVYFLLILFLKDNLVDYIYFIAIIYGLEEGFYYSVYNNFESSCITNNQRQRFSGIYTMIKSLISIIVPIIFGGLITSKSFSFCTTVVLILVVFQVILSFVFQDDHQENLAKVDLREYKRQLKKLKWVNKMHKISFLNGIIYSGAFSSIITLYVIKVLNNSIELGLFSSIFAIITCFLGFFFAKILPKKNYKITIIISSIFTVLGIGLLIYKTSFLIVVIFNLLQTCSATFINLIIDNKELDMANYNCITKKYRIEYFITMEKNTFIGRLLGYFLYIVLGITSIHFLNHIVLFVFEIIIVILSIYIIQLNDAVGE